ncbi:MAG: MATE family efflux transporter [Spirochaetales bacterium]|nr:MATE family efflux transporter [Spirochaetales bacterium]
MERDKQKNMILNDNLWGVMWKLSWPAIIAMVLYGLNTIFDAIFVGRFVGEEALAGVSLAYPLSQLPLGLGQLVGVGAGSALSIALGANDHVTQRKLLGNANYLNILFSIVYSILGIIFAVPIVKMMGGMGAALGFGADYFRVTCYGSVFWITGLAYNMIVRAEGKMGSAAIMMGSGLVVNVIANYFLIVVLGFGVKGAAWGTNIGMLVYTIVFFIYASNKNKISFDAKPFSVRRDKNVTKSIINMGVPSMIMAIMSVVQGVVVMNALSHYGTTSDIAFYGIAYRIFMFLLTPVFGLMRALQPAIGINFGAEKYDRVISSFKIFGVAATVLMAPFWAIMMINPELVLHLMLPTKDFIASDLSNFRFFTALLPVLPVIFMAMTFFPAINNSKPSAIMGIARQLVFYVPVMLIVPRYFGVSWVYKGAFLIDLVIIIWVFIMVIAEFKKLRRGEVNRVESLKV